MTEDIPGSTENNETSLAKTGVFDSLRLPNFRWLLTGSQLSYALGWVQGVLLSWLVYDLTGSGTILGSMSLAISLAMLLVMPVSGLLLDHFNRRNLMTVETGVMVLLTLGLGFSLLTGHRNIASLFIFTFVSNMIVTLDTNLRQVLVFDLVPRTITPSALALNQTGWSVMRFLGPSIGGFLLIWTGAGGAFLIQAAVYLLICVTALRIKMPERKREPVQSSVLQNIREGVSYLAREPVTRTFTLICLIMPVLILPIFTTLPAIYAVQVFGDESGRVLGFLMASVGLGGVIGGIAFTYLRRLEHWGRLQIASVFLVSLSLVGFAFTSTLWAGMALLVLAGLFEIIFLTTNLTLIQLSIPDNLRARVTSVVNLIWISVPVGSLLAGGGSDLLGGPKIITAILSGTAAVIAVIVFLASPTVRNYRLSQGISTPGTER